MSEEEIMGKKLYVGNLPFSTTDQELSEIFTQVGPVASAKVIMDRDSGRSKGFGFVEMASDEAALNAISQFNGAQLNGRPLTVNEARPMAPRSNSQHDGMGSSRGFGGGGNRNERNNRW